MNAADNFSTTMKLIFKGKFESLNERIPNAYMHYMFFDKNKGNLF